MRSVQTIQASPRGVADYAGATDVAAGLMHLYYADDGLQTVPGLDAELK
jgi:hypothetical protein